MNKIVDYLVKEGFKPYRYSCKKNEYKLCNNQNHFSSMSSNGFSYLAVFYKKDNETYVFGLNEVNKPPTLIRPRPKIVIEYFDEEIITKYQIDDDAMNHVLRQESTTDIINYIKKGLVFRYKL